MINSEIYNALKQAGADSRTKSKTAPELARLIGLTSTGDSQAVSSLLSNLYLGPKVLNRELRSDGLFTYWVVRDYTPGGKGRPQSVRRAHKPTSNSNGSAAVYRLNIDGPGIVVDRSVTGLQMLEILKLIEVKGA